MTTRRLPDPKFPRDYPGSAEIRSGRRRVVHPTLRLTFTPEQYDWILEQARIERVPVSWIARRCIQAAMVRLKELQAAEAA